MLNATNDYITDMLESIYPYVLIYLFFREKYLEKQAMGLVVMKKSTIISEYKVIREILWQLWDLHTSSVFHFEGNDLTTRSNITISSSRAVSR